MIWDPKIENITFFSDKMALAILEGGDPDLFHYFRTFDSVSPSFVLCYKRPQKLYASH